MGILIFWEKHGTKATLDAFPVKRRTLFNWKARIEKSGGRLESLNNQSRVPKKKRIRAWSLYRNRFARLSADRQSAPHSGWKYNVQVANLNLRVGWTYAFD